MQKTPEEKRSLYLRWRPVRFEEVVGQEGPVRIIKNSVKKGKAAHAYLFAGPRGTGKTSVARILAKALNCENGQSGEPCNTCSSCQKIEKGTALDIVEIDGASNRGIDKIRELREEVNFAPAELDNKVYIIDEVHMLTTQAFNALLKTIEEPPDSVTFIFATTEPEKVPATIISRCQVFEFTEIERGEIKARLRQVANSEDVKISEDALELISSRARGSMRDGLVLLEQIFSYGTEGEVTRNDLFELLGLTKEEVTEKYIGALIENRPKEALDVLDDLESRGRDPELFLDQVLEKLRGRIKGADDPRRLKRLVELSRGILDTSDDLKRSSHKRVVLEIGTLELMEKKVEVEPVREDPEDEGLKESSRETTIEEAPEGREEPDTAEEKVPSGNGEERESDEREPVSGAVKDRGEESGNLKVESQWEEMIGRIEDEKISIAAFLEEANPVLRNQDLYLEFGKEFSFHKESLEKKQNFSYLREIVKDYFEEVDELRIIYNENEDRTNSSGGNLLDEKAKMVKEKFGGNIVEEGRL